MAMTRCLACPVDCPECSGYDEDCDCYDHQPNEEDVW